MTTYAQVIEFVFAEVARFARMDLEERRKLSFSDLLFGRLPHPAGRGEILCGMAAYRRLQEVAGLAISRSQFAGRIAPDAVFRELRTIFVQRFLCEERKRDEQQASRAVAAAIKRVARTCADLIHYVPCHLTDDSDPVSFSIGPVTFHQYSSLCERLEPALQAYLNRSQNMPSRTGEPTDRREIAEMIVVNRHAMLTP